MIAKRDETLHCADALIQFFLFPTWKKIWPIGLVILDRVQSRGAILHSTNKKTPAWNLFDHDPICQFTFHTKQLARCTILSLKYEVMMIQTRRLSQTLSSNMILYFHYYSLDIRKCKYNLRNNYYYGSRTAYSIVQQMILYCCG